MITACLMFARLESSVHVVRSEFIFESAPFPSCHASTIVQASNGDLLASWFGGTAESNPDVKVYLARWAGKAWTIPSEIAAGTSPTGQPLPCYNPVLFQPKHGPVLLFYKVGTGPSTWWGMMKRSNDNGLTWGAPERLPDGILGPIKNKPLELEDGTLLCPSSSEDRGWTVHFEFTKNLGRTWTKTGPLNDGVVIGAIQPSILKLSGGRMRAIGRTRQGFLFQTDSTDEGRTWGPLTLTSLSNPNSGTDAVTLRDGRHLLVYNPSKNARTPLAVALSKDGENWKDILTIENASGEFSYPAVIQTSDGLVHITYTWQRRRIRHVVLKVEEANG